MANIKIERLPVFVNEAFHFELPNFKRWQDAIKQIVLVEDNGLLNTSPEAECNIKAKRTGWNSHLKYPILYDLVDEIEKYIQIFIEKEGYDVPKLGVMECWINWYKKNQYALPHKHGEFLSVVLFVDVEDTDAKLFFHADHNLVLIKKTDVETNFSNVKSINGKNGSVIFFDGMISHSVSQNNSDKNRISVAINYLPYYANDREQY